MASKHESAPLAEQELADLLEKLANARTVTDVNIAAGIALNALHSIDA